MKLPFNVLLSPILKSYLGNTRTFCDHPTFFLSDFYTYLYATLGFLISANHLRKHLGETPTVTKVPYVSIPVVDQNFMLVHDLKIIATSMGIVQYICLLVGCATENPSLFLPHLTGQLVMVVVKILNAMLLLCNLNFKSLSRLKYKMPPIIMMTFNWFQEFCVFRKYLCVCDL